MPFLIRVAMSAACSQFRRSRKRGIPARECTSWLRKGAPPTFCDATSMAGMVVLGILGHTKACLVVGDEDRMRDGLGLFASPASSMFHGGLPQAASRLSAPEFFAIRQGLAQVLRILVQILRKSGVPCSPIRAGSALRLAGEAQAHGCATQVYAGTRDEWLV